MFHQLLYVLVVIYLETRMSFKLARCFRQISSCLFVDSQLCFNKVVGREYIPNKRYFCHTSVLYSSKFNQCLSTQYPEHHLVNKQKLQEELAAGENVHVVDVRGGDEIEMHGKIAGSLNIPCMFCL